VTDILSDETARQPAFGANNPLVLSRPAAAKTGTTSDYRDNWTLGYTRYLVTGVWAGNSDGHPMQSASGVTGAAPIWHDFMEGILGNPELLARLEAPADPIAWQFVAPSGVEQLDVCPPNLGCRAGGEFFRSTWLELQGEAGPLGDSIAQIASASTYVQQGEQSRLAGFCGVQEGAPRLMLLLPGMHQRAGEQTPLPQFFEVTENAEGDAGAEIPAMTLAQRHVLAWAVRQGSAVYLGLATVCRSFYPWR
jgi:membrane peptidoglycan carboxypeptidase